MHKNSHSYLLCIKQSWLGSFTSLCKSFFKILLLVRRTHILLTRMCVFTSKYWGKYSVNFVLNDCLNYSAEQKLFFREICGALIQVQPVQEAFNLWKVRSEKCQTPSDKISMQSKFIAENLVTQRSVETVGKHLPQHRREKDRVKSKALPRRQASYHDQLKENSKNVPTWTV